ALRRHVVRVPRIKIHRDQMPGHQAASCKARARTRLTSTGTPSLLRAGCQTRPPNTSTSRTCAGARMPARPVLRPVKWALLESDLRGGSVGPGICASHRRAFPATELATAICRTLAPGHRVGGEGPLAHPAPRAVEARMAA